MTIYSSHPNRGKVQILATYRGRAGVVSETVTSIDPTHAGLRDAPQETSFVSADAIVDALNRISACATLPVSVDDSRLPRRQFYPDLHIAALSDRTVRANLLVGTHSLWYEYVKVLLHEALVDLDDATRGLPGPVLTAISAELEAEASELREALAQWDGRSAGEDVGNHRRWRFNAPFVQFEGGLDALSNKERGSLDWVERGLTAEQLSRVVADMRLLAIAFARSGDDLMTLDIGQLRLMDKPGTAGADRLFLEVTASMPHEELGQESWDLEILRWNVAGPDGLDAGPEESVLRCSRSTAPTVDELVDLLDLRGDQAWQLGVWAKTPVGEALDGTTFVVTERFDV